MGNVFSSVSTTVESTVTSESEIMSNRSDSSDTNGNDNVDEEYLDAINEDQVRAQNKEDEMNEFRKQLNIKREQRRQILDRHKNEKLELEKALSNERKSRLEFSETNKLLRELLLKNNIEIPENLLSNENAELSSTIAQMRDEFENLRTNNNQLRRDLAESNNTLQKAYSDIADLNSQNIESLKHICALKEVVSVSKTMIALREQQLDELKNKLNEIEKSLADREASMLSTDLRQEYERQLQNIRTLRGLYEERARLAEVTRQSLVRELEEQKVLYQAEVNKSKKLTDKVKELEDKVDALIETIENKNSEISVCQDESIGLKAEMTVVNKLFSEVLLGYKTKKDLDKLVHRLEENHGILTQMAERENDTEASTALPKLLLELVNQIEEEEDLKKEEDLHDKSETSSEQNIRDSGTIDFASTPTPEEIVQKLPKVWRVLMELLSHQNVAETNTTEKVTTCYKSVETKSGPVLVPSVSQTYIRLKDLIMEKLTLIKEVNRMKQLNSHLETRLEKQERRLCLVTTELSKTWHVVGRLRRHHHQLHTHEKILKYELQQKRKLLNELKEELEYCREKWEQAREKNSQSERDWRTLRAEFTSRKTKLGSPSFNNSGESGYSDERPSDESSESNDESEYVTESPIRCKKKLKKSFETIIDSSADFNLAAEREDPASDMLDVADLPHDDSHSENISRNELVCEETEDEVCDINGDPCTEDIIVRQNLTNDSSINSTISQNEHMDVNNATSFRISQVTSSTSHSLIDPKDNLQNERLPNKDEKFVELEENSASLLQEVHHSAEFNKEVNKNLDHILNQPTTSRDVQNISTITKDNESELSNQSLELNDKKFETCDSHINDNSDINTTTQSGENSKRNIDESPELNRFQSILESIKRQDERLAEKDKRFQELEGGCSDVLSSINNTLQTGENLKQRLTILHARNMNSNDFEDKSEDEDSKDSSSTNGDEAEPSTSSDIDHEARFAARDIRLKRLEEQTKSLVNKVNKTTSKGVKINYKLEELHNIYGSDNSRAGTPSEENEDKNDDVEA
ncbi:unnamed protein product [Diatraea saccharalis]|uniref:Uncharacterized protein n=1 Tax=Diatraea saccharalis TaxID=40085 RepID=A0A9N9R2S6_9NEOP|nr:unnamed protein product [Diatraea saccharalis]